MTGENTFYSDFHTVTFANQLKIDISILAKHKHYTDFDTKSYKDYITNLLVIHFFFLKSVLKQAGYNEMFYLIDHLIGLFGMYPIWPQFIFP